MKSIHFTRLYAAGAAATLIPFAFCDASFSTTSSLTLTTADLSAQNINITFSTNQPTLMGTVNPNSNYGSVGGSGYVIFPSGSNNGTSQLNLQVTTAANGNATSTGTAIASARERQSIRFYNSGKVEQRVTVNWSDTLTSVVTANNGFANCISGTSGYQLLPYNAWNQGVHAFTPNKLSDPSSNSGSFMITVGASRTAYLQLTSVSRGIATSYIPMGAPEPSGLAALGVGSLGLLLGFRRKR